MRILITAGGTREYIDPVRFISNASSGQRVTYGPDGCRTRAYRHADRRADGAEAPPSASVINVLTSDDMFKAVKSCFDDCDCLIMAAAVSDYTPMKTSKTKIKKSSANLTLQLKPAKDILKWAGRNKNGRVLVGFALEDDVRQLAEQKLREKKLDLILANAPDAIGTSAATFHIRTADGPWAAFPDMAKTKIAAKLITQIETIARSNPRLDKQEYPPAVPAPRLTADRS